MVFRISPVLLPVVAVELLYRIGAFLQDLLQKDPGRYMGLVRKDRRVQFPGEVIDGHTEIPLPLKVNSPLSSGSRFVSR